MSLGRQRDCSLAVFGHVTRDLILRKGRIVAEHVGGSTAFAALATAMLGYECMAVTVAPREILVPLQSTGRIRLHIKPCDSPTTFELDYVGGSRKLRLLNRAPPLLAQDVPTEARVIPVAYVCPVMDECGLATIRTLRSECIVLSLQGWLRQAADDGSIGPTIPPDLRTLSGIRAVCFSEEDHPDSDVLARELTQHVELVALTRGAKGVTLYQGAQKRDLPASPAREVDPTGAGDVFGVILALALGAGKPWVQAGNMAVRVAARVVEGSGLGTLSPTDSYLLQA